MATHSSTLAWKIPWVNEPGRLQSMGLLRVRHDWVTSLSLFNFHALEKDMATHSSVSCLENPRDGGAWWAAVYGVAQSRTWLKRLSNSSWAFFGIAFLWDWNENWHIGKKYELEWKPKSHHIENTLILSSLSCQSVLFSSFSFHYLD